MNSTLWTQAPPRHISRQNLDQLLQLIHTRFNGDYSALADSLIVQIRDYVKTIPRPVLIVGLSGGIDSAVVAALAVRAVGQDKVLAITMANGIEDHRAIARAERFRQTLGLAELGSSSTLQLLPILETYRMMTRKQNWPIPEDTTLNGNLASRLRVAILYDLQRSLSGRVLGTGNRTEFVQGFAAKYGTPISYDFGILDELYKTDVYQLALELDIPKEILIADPATGYSSRITHEEELDATLFEQDAAAYLLFEKRVSSKMAIRAGFAEKYVRTMRNRYVAGKHKRMLQQPHATVKAVR